MHLKALGVLPWFVLLVGMPFLNTVEPFVLGLPLPLAYAVFCTLLSAAVLLVIFALDRRNKA